MADPNKKSQELQRKFDQIMADLREQDELLAEAAAKHGGDYESFAATLPKVRFCAEPPRVATRKVADVFLRA
jgi:hypothetical protein